MADERPVKLVTAAELAAHPEYELARPNPIPRGPSAGKYAVYDVSPEA